MSTTTTLPLPDRLRNQLPPSARLIHLALCSSDSPLEVEEVVEETGVSIYQTRTMLNELHREGFIEIDIHPSDRRRRVYSATAPGATDDAVAATP